MKEEIEIKNVEILIRNNLLCSQKNKKNKGGGMIKELFTQNIKDIEFRLKLPCYILRAKKSKSIYQKKKDKLKKHT